MNKTLGGVIAVIVILAAGIGIYASNLTPKEEDAMMEKQKMTGEMKQDVMTDDAMMEKNDGSMMEKEEAMTKDEGSMMDTQESMTTDKAMMAKDEPAMMKAGSYEAYGAEKIAAASDAHNVVLFFRAGWCPTCRALDADIHAHLGDIPADLTILDVNYDTSNDLKKKYGVTYQHTFVQVDAQGNVIKKWSGSPTLAALVTEVQ